MSCCILLIDGVRLNALNSAYDVSSLILYDLVKTDHKLTPCHPLHVLLPWHAAAALACCCCLCMMLLLLCAAAPACAIACCCHCLCILLLCICFVHTAGAQQQNLNCSCTCGLLFDVTHSHNAVLHHQHSRHVIYCAMSSAAIPKAV